MDCFSRFEKSKKLTDAQKGRIISLRFEGHYSLETIAQLANTSVKTDRMWLDRYAQDGNVQRRFGPGRPRVTTDAQNIAMVQYLKANPFSSTVRAAALQNAPYRTALPRVHESGLGNHVAAHQIKLTERHKQVRMNYCRSMLEFFREENFEKIIFTDEKTFRSDESNSVRVYRPRGQRYLPQFVCEDSRSGFVSAGYWGWISCAGPGELVKTGPHFNANVYLDILEEVALPSIERQFGSIDNIFFIHDNSSVHNAGIVRQFLEGRRVPMLKHPALSPDLNLIEYIWSMMERDRPPLIQRNHAGLNEHVFNRWENLRGRQGKFTMEIFVAAYTI